MIINEIFYSIQGESTFAGLPCVFIRLTGCNLRCRYCDTKYAYEEGEELTLSDVLKIIRKYNCNLVEITGGEPLLQPDTVEISKKLIYENRRVLIETNGTQDISVLPAEVVRIMDIKCPGSGECDNTDWSNIAKLKPTDNVKFVVTDKTDFDWAEKIVLKYDLTTKTHVLFSPAFGIVKPKELAKWILESGMPVRMQLQAHKYIWDPMERGV